ncbi:hypothetical protein [Corallococcus sp. CA053C]|uniref:hypothetical protein n=1 Tax=Corallococcus sp. CA053C TaxID=2316732 RepID=UPI0018F76EC5|nr:hypothetical protein [Corallococcus sp. CA053C]
MRNPTPGGSARFISEHSPRDGARRAPGRDEDRARKQPHDLDGPLRVSSSLQQHVDWLGEDLRLGFERLYLHNVNREQDAFIDAFGAKVIPALTR